MAKQIVELVHCRYPKCSKLHETTELKKEDAVKGGGKKSYYHPDCWHTLQTINKIRDLFFERINPLMTGKQIGMLVATINNMVFDKKIDVNFILFSLQYFIKNKPDKLQQIYGIHYIVQDKDVIAAWKKEKENRLREKIKTEIKKQEDDLGEIVDLDLSDDGFVYKPQKQKGFDDILC